MYNSSQDISGGVMKVDHYKLAVWLGGMVWCTACWLMAIKLLF